MTKAEKYWVFGMVVILCIEPQESPTLWTSISNVFCYIAGCCFFIAMVWAAIRGKEK